jgi:hypothetical protein
MNERDKALSELRQGIGGIDPMLDLAENYGRGVKAVQSVVRQQGEVTSLALANNHQLYHTNKKLVARSRELEAEMAGLRRRFDIISQQNQEQARYIAQLEAAGGDRYKPLYEHAARTLAAFMHDAIPVDQLPAKLKAMKKQAAEIEAMPERATEEEINEIAPDTELVPLDERDPLTEITEPLQ